MIRDRQVASVTVRAPAKVNLHLGVAGLRPDGFHELVNVFQAVSLFDEVTVSRSDRLRVTVSGVGTDRVPLDSSNLVWRAATALAARWGIAPAVHVHIDKCVPVAGGMAGGSADAAAALVGCGALWGGPTEFTTLRHVAAQLGGDVRFALTGGVAMGRGRGELPTSWAVRRPLHWAFATLDEGLSTPAVFAELDRLRGPRHLIGDMPAGPLTAVAPELAAAVMAGDAEAAGRALRNDLEAAAVSLRPALGDVMRHGMAAGALRAMVSGSGPTVAFLARDAAGAGAVAASLRSAGLTATTAYGPVPGARVTNIADCPHRGAAVRGRTRTRKRGAA